MVCASLHTRARKFAPAIPPTQAPEPYAGGGLSTSGAAAPRRGGTGLAAAPCATWATR